MMQNQEVTPLLFDVEYISPNGTKFRVLPVTPADAKEATDIVAHAFVTREPLTKALNMTYEEIMREFKVTCQRNIDENLGVIVKDPNGRIVGVQFFQDEYNEKHNPMQYPDICDATKDTLDMLGECHTEIEVSKKYEVILTSMGGVLDDPELRGQRIFEKMLHFIAHDHPISSKARLLVGQTTNAKVLAVQKKLGWEIIGCYHPKKFVNKKGELIFKDIDRVNQELFGCDFPGIYSTIYKNKSNLAFQSKPKL